MWELSTWRRGSGVPPVEGPRLQAPGGTGLWAEVYVQCGSDRGPVSALLCSSVCPGAWRRRTALGSRCPCDAGGSGQPLFPSMPTPLHLLLRADGALDACVAGLPCPLVSGWIRTWEGCRGDGREPWSQSLSPRSLLAIRLVVFSVTLLEASECWAAPPAATALSCVPLALLLGPWPSHSLIVSPGPTTPGK